MRQTGCYRRALVTGVLALGWLGVSSPLLAETRCYLDLSGPASQFGYSRGGPYGSLAQCQAMAQTMNVVARCSCTTTAPPTNYTPPVNTGPTQAELDEQRRRREEKEKADRQAEFLRQRDEAAKVLKGNPPATPNAGNLKGVPPSAPPIKDLKSATDVRDLGGANAAWKQLNCAASIGGFAIAALRRPRGADYDEYNYLAREAVNALNGARLGVQCPAPVAAPEPYGRSGFDAMKARYAALLRRVDNDAKALRDSQLRRRTHLDAWIDDQRKIADLDAANKAAHAQELARLQALRQSLGPATLKQAPAPPPPREPPPQEKQEPGRALEAALAAARAAKAAYETQTKREGETKADLDGLRRLSSDVEKGVPSAADQLAKMFP